MEKDTTLFGWRCSPAPCDSLALVDTSGYRIQHFMTDSVRIVMSLLLFFDYFFKQLLSV
jgi:hypothetical protein